MCGIVGKISTKEISPKTIERMNSMISHRGPDDEGIWHSKDKHAGLGHKRLSIIDLSNHGHQPMHALGRYTIVFNGEIYNYKDIKRTLRNDWNFTSQTDTEVILAAYVNYGKQCLEMLRGMFSFAIWDDNDKVLFCARDHFGIKPFYYNISNDGLAFASEAKALSPALSSLTIDKQALFEYLNFQLPLSSNTLIEEIKQLPPAHTLTYSARTKSCHIERFWNLNYEVDNKFSDESLTIATFQEIMHESVALHLNSDVPIGSYLSGGIDSSLISIMASEYKKDKSELTHSFHGKFSEYNGYDESFYAKKAASFPANKQVLNIADITLDDFLNNIEKVIYHLDFPVAGPGSLPQYMVSKLASQHVKVVLGGQGGDELFGGYTRYMIGYLEQCIKASITGTHDLLEIPFKNILPNLITLKQYTPLIKSVWSKGLFDDFEYRYYRIVNRSNDFQDEVNWEGVNGDPNTLMENFNLIFNAENASGSGYINKMLHFDFKTLLPSLLQVEDRMSMAHSIESRVPFLDYKIAEFAAKIPPSVKFSNGNMKHIIKSSFKDKLPSEILTRKDKMGFPVPLKEWFQTDKCRSYLIDIFSQGMRNGGEFINYDVVIKSLREDSEQFSRKIWGLLSLEIWLQNIKSTFPVR